MRTYFIIGSTNLGGAEIQAIEQANLFIKRGHFVTLVILSNNGRISNSLLNLIKKREINFKIYQYKNINFFANFINLFLIAKKISKESDLVIGLTRVPNLITSLCSNRVYKIWQQRDVLNDNQFLLFDYFLALRCNLIIANSRLAQNFIKKKTFYLTNPKIMGNLLDKRLIKVKYINKKNPLIFINVSNFKKSKNHKELINIWKIFYQRIYSLYNIRPELILVGNFYEFKFTNKKIKNLKNKYRIRIYQNCSDPIKFYKQSSFYLSSTTSESRSNSIDHAMFFGLPIVGFEHASLFDQICELNLKYLSNAHSSQELVQNLMKLILNTKDIKKIGMNNRNNIIKYFNQNTLAWRKFIDNF